MAKTVMTNTQYVDTLKHIASIPTVYKNKFPYNCGYYDGVTGRFSFDCWNLVKSVINGWQDIRVNGYYVKGFKVTGDIDGATILKRCTTKSKDFTKISIPGTYLYLPGHAGSYIGETVINGKYYNVIECTGAWTKNVLYSWVDQDGTRRRYKGGAKSSKWTDWGLMCWIDYSGAQPTPTPTPQPTPTPTPTPTPDESRIILGKYFYTSPFDKAKVDMGYAFNPTYYRNHQSDVAKDKYYGKNDKTLFEHFKEHGMIEGRQAITSFNLEAYKQDSLKNHNGDLQKAYGTKKSDNPDYYEHWCRFGHNEPNRKAT